MEEWNTKMERVAKMIMVVALVLFVVGILIALALWEGPSEDFGKLICLMLSVVAAIMAAFGARRNSKYQRFFASKSSSANMQTSVPDKPESAYRIEERKEIIREIVKVKCRYCGTLNPQEAQKCTSCGGHL